MWTAWNRLAARLRAMFTTRALDDDFDREVDSHLALLIQENVRRGMTPDEARRAALVRFGGVAALKEAHRDTRGLPPIETLRQDLRYAVRTLRRDPGFALFATLIVGLGIGASVIVYSVVNAVLLRPLPFRDPGALVWIANSGEGLSGQTVQVGYVNELRRRSSSFAALGAYCAFYGVGDSKLTGAGEPERLNAVPISERFFETLGVQPQLGRFFTADDEPPFAPNSAILTDALWRRRFGADPGIVGRTISLNERSVTIVAVLPASFEFAAVFAPGSRVDLFLPFPLTEQTHRRGNTIAIVGRLKPGVTVERAREETGALVSHIRRDQPGWNNFEPQVTGLADRVSARVRPALVVLAAAAAVVMLIVCANLSNLLVARAAARQKEMAIRVALGAGRGRLIRQMLTESLVLSGFGAALGLAFAVAGTRIVSHLDAFSIPLLGSVRVDPGALGFTLLVALATGLLFGLAPALQVPALAVHGSLKDAGRGTSGSRRLTWIRGALVVSEIAFACALLVCAGLLVRSFLRVLEVDLGFRPGQTIALRVDPSARYDTQPRRNTYYDTLLQQVRALPGVTGAGLTDALPLTGNRSWSAGAKGQVYTRESPPPEAFIRIVSDGYLTAMGIPLRAGRDFTADDTPSTRRVVLINESLARALWPGQDPIGKTVIYLDAEREVIGVVADVRHLALEEGSGGEAYIPIRQTGDYSAVDLVVRSTAAPAALAASVRGALHAIEPTLPANESRSLQQLVDKAVSPRRFVVLLLAGFSAFALLLASLGIYGVISYAVSQRAQEIGIRMALGASAGAVQTGILLQTLRLAAVGMLIGLIASWILGRAIGGLLFGVTAHDPVTFAAMLAILTAVAAAAGYLPARRASRIDPTIALRG